MWGEIGVPLLLISILQELSDFVCTVLYPSAREHTDKEKIILNWGRVQKYWVAPFIVFLVSFPK